MNKTPIIFALAALCTVGTAFGSWVFTNDINKIDVEVEEDIGLSSPKLYTISYKGFNDSSNMTSFVFGKDFVDIDGFKNTYVTGVKMGETDLVEKQDFYINNDTFSVPNLTDDLEISAIQPVTQDLMASTSKYNRTDEEFGDFKVYNETDLYDGNNGDLEYSNAGGLKVTGDLPVAYLDLNDTSLPKITNAFTANLTIKGDPDRYHEQSGHQFPSAIIGIRDIDVEGYLLWVGFFKEYLHIYAFRRDNWDAEKTGEKEYGFISIPFSQFALKVVNVHVVAQSGKVDGAHVYINDGTKEVSYSFNTNSITVDYDHFTLGDLHIGRNLKLDGYIYDVSIYNRALTRAEIDQNVAYAKAAFPLGI